MPNSIYSFSNFNFNILLIFGIAVFNILYKVKVSPEKIYLASNLWNPTALVLGPLLLWSIQANFGLENKNIRWHLLPFLFAFIFFGVALYDTTRSAGIYDMYQMTSWAIPLSLFIYLINILTSKRKFKPIEGIRAELLILIYVSTLFIAMITTLVYICEVLDIDMGINYRFFTHTLLLSIAIFILRYFLLSQIKKNLTVVEETPSYANSALSQEKINAYLQQIQQYFEASQAFLRPDLSLNVLADELNIPKHYFSQLFNVHLGKSFYQYVAEYRIAYATKRMEEENIRIKIESLAYECGFNSKTSFNKYFKSVVGCTPVEHLRKKNNETLDQTS